MLKQIVSRLHANNLVRSGLQYARRDAFSRLASHRIKDYNTDSVPFDFTPENYKRIDQILKKYPEKSKKAATMPLLWLAQEQNDNFLPLSAMKKVAKILEISDMEVYEVASFYTMYNRDPVGKFHIQICGTTPCMLCGSREITKAIEEYTGAKLGQTSADGLFTLEEVECLGACVNAPMVQVNNQKFYEDLTPENVKKLLEDLKNGTAKVGPQINRNSSEGPQGRTSLDSEWVKNGGLGPVERDFSKAKKEWEDQKAAEKAEAEKRKAQAAAQAAAAAKK